MKITTLAVLVFASCIVAKNVVFLDDLLAAIENSDSGNEKRDARNVVALDNLDPEHATPERRSAEKRDARNVVDTKKLIGRDARNVVDTKKLIGRDARNVVDTKKLIGRDARNVVDFKKLIGKRDSGAQQPEALLLESVLPQVHDISIFSGYLRDDEAIRSSLQRPDSFMLFLAPTDGAIADYSAQYGAKPWQYPQEVPTDDTEDQVVRNNLAFFVRAHAADAMSTDDDRISSRLLDGREFAVERVGGLDQYVVVLDGQRHPVSSVYSAENGLVFVVGSVLISR